MYGMADRDQRVEAALERLGLAERGNQLAGTLSGGWKQRLALSACLLHDPLLLLLDEPTAGVDPEARREFWEELHAFAATGITVLVSTHYMDEAERCHKLAYILNGRLLAQGTVEEVVAGQKLVGWSVEGPDLVKLAEKLRAIKSVEQIAAFGGRLHVVGRDKDRMDADLASFRQDSNYKWEAVQPGLEDVRVRLREALGQPVEEGLVGGVARGLDLAGGLGREAVAGEDDAVEAVAADDGAKDLTAAASSSMMSKTVYSLVICITSWTLFVRLSSFNSPPCVCTLV